MLLGLGQILNHRAQSADDGVGAALFQLLDFLLAKLPGSKGAAVLPHKIMFVQHLSSHLQAVA